MALYRALFSTEVNSASSVTSADLSLAAELRKQ